MDKFRHFVLDRHTSFLPGRRQLGTEEKGGGVWFNREPVSVKSTRNREEAITVVNALSLRHTAQESTSFPFWFKSERAPAPRNIAHCSPSASGQSSIDRPTMDMRTCVVSCQVQLPGSPHWSRPREAKI